MIQADLMDVGNGSQLWGNHYNSRLSDILSVQEEIAREISEKLRLRLTGEEKEKLTKRYTANTEAYQFYLKGRYAWEKRTESGLQQSIEYFQQAIEKDPGYALAYAGLADSYAVLPSYSILSPAESIPRARTAARKRSRSTTVWRRRTPPSPWLSGNTTTTGPPRRLNTGRQSRSSANTPPLTTGTACC